MISRNILSTGLCPLLREIAGARIILLVPAFKRAFFEDSFGGEGIIVEGVDDPLSWRDSLGRYLSLAALSTNSLAIKRKTEMKGSGQWIAPILGRNNAGKIFARTIDTLIGTYGAFESLIEKYRPDAVFATDVQHEYDVRLLRAAHRRGIRTVGMVRSWDNLTSKGILRTIPETLIVHNEIEKKEAILLHGVEESALSVVGIPHYDAYVKRARSRRDVFCQSVGLDSEKQFVLFAPIGDRYIKNNTVDRDVLAMLDAALPSQYQILVRFPPSDTVKYLDGLSSNSRIVFDRPAKHFKTPKNAELSSNDDAHLADSLFWSDLLVAGPSTLCIDAAVFDKPAVLIGFDGNAERPYYESVARYYDYDHFHPIMESGGVSLVTQKEGFGGEIRRMLEHPELLKEGRKRIVSEQCGLLGGKSTERLAKVILPYL